jgi:hypothetical protein
MAAKKNGPGAASEVRGRSGTLKVNSEHLAEALRLVKRIKINARREISLSYADGNLVIEYPEARLLSQATGEWGGTALVKLGKLRAVADAKFAPGEVTVLVADGRIYIGGFSAECEWQPDGP